MRCLMVLLVGYIALALTSACRAEEPFLVYCAGRAAETPVIDGKLTESCWQKAEETAPFVRIGGSPAPCETRGRVCWDDEHLYVAIVCPEPLMPAIQERRRARAMGFMEESTEIFVDSDYDRITYLQFRVGIQGERDTHRGNDPDDGLTDQWRGAAAIGNDAWTVEVALPFGLLGARPAPGAVWGLNLNRQRCVNPDGMYTCWSDTKGGFHSPDRFGRLLSQPFPAWLPDYCDQHAEALLGEMTAITRSYPFCQTAAAARRQALDEHRRHWRQQVTGRADSADQRAPLFADAQKLIAGYEESLATLRREVISRQFQAGK